MIIFLLYSNVIKDIKLAILEEDLQLIQTVHSIKASNKCINNSITYLTDKGLKFNSELYHVEFLGMFDIDYVAIKKSVQHAEELSEQYLQQYRHEFLLLPESDNKTNKLYIDLENIKDTIYYLEEGLLDPDTNSPTYIISQIELFNKQNFDKKYSSGKLIITDENNTHGLAFFKYSNKVNFTTPLKFVHNKKYLILLYGKGILEPLHNFHIQILDKIQDSHTLHYLLVED